MVTRKIRLADPRGRDATVLLMPVSHRSERRYQSLEGRPVESIRRVKSTEDTHADVLYRRYPDPEDFVRALTAEDPEMDLELVGRATGSCDRVYLNPDNEIIYSPRTMEIRYGPDGTEVERRPKRIRPANTVTSNLPVWSGVHLPVDDAIRRYAFTRVYQVVHTNALEFDFLMGIASYLQERESMVLVGSGRNGRGPLVLERNGPRYRGFLHGRVIDDSMSLVLYLSQVELRIPEDMA